MTTNKLSLAPAVLLSSVLLLTACSTGSPPPVNPPVNSVASATQSSIVPSSTPTIAQDGYVAADKNMEQKFKSFYYAPPTLTSQGWELYKSAGATTYKEDQAARPTTLSEWTAARDAGKANEKNFMVFQKMLGEMSSDVDQSAMQVSAFLAKNPSAKLDAVKADKSLVINRFPKAGTTGVYQDSTTGFYFVVFSPNEENKMADYGILVPQKGKTPNFEAPSGAGQ